MSEPERITATRRIAAPASDIFKILADPNGHVRIDGSGMLMAAPDATPLSSVGDSFAMDMDREPLGDFPMGKYKVVNTVTRFTPDTEIEWNVGAEGRTPIGHVYGYQLAPVSDTETEVSTYCDWSNLSEKVRGRITFPVVPLAMLEQSLANLDRVVTT